MFRMFEWREIPGLGMQAVSRCLPVKYRALRDPLPCIPSAEKPTETLRFSLLTPDR